MYAAGTWSDMALADELGLTEATYRAERYEDQVARLFDRVRLSEDDLGQVLRAMRGAEPVPAEPDPTAQAAAREELQGRLAAGSINIEAFSRAWRQLDRPVTSAPLLPDELRLRRARKVLAESGTLWRNPAVPDQLREEALREILSQVDVDGPEIVAVHPAPNENAWLLGLVPVREQKLTAQREVGLVGARGDEPPRPTLTSPSRGVWRAASQALTPLAEQRDDSPAVPEPSPGGDRWRNRDPARRGPSSDRDGASR